jgi:hypothetical protein
MKITPLVASATAITFAAGIALVGTGERALIETQLRKLSLTEKTTPRGGRKVRSVSTRPKLDPTGGLTKPRVGFR